MRKSQLKNKPVKFRVRYKFDLNGTIMEGEESEASWFYLDQRGDMYDSAPFRPISPCGSKYVELIPLLKVNDEYLSIEEIEQKVNDLQKFQDMFTNHNITSEETTPPNRLQTLTKEK